MEIILTNDFYVNPTLHAMNGLNRCLSHWFVTFESVAVPHFTATFVSGCLQQSMRAV